MSKTPLGKIMRAVAQDRIMAGALGINVPQLFTRVFMLGAWLGGVAGVLVAPLRTLNPAMADNVIIESFRDCL
ncbi:ABC transporter permease subunit [Dapis sp. BLCC M229]